MFSSLAAILSVDLLRSCPCARPLSRAAACSSTATARGSAARPAAPTAAYWVLRSSCALADHGISSQSRQTHVVFNSPEVGRGQGRAQAVEELPFELRLVEEPPARARVDDAGLVSATRIAPWPPVRPGKRSRRPASPCASLRRSLRHTLAAIIGERSAGCSSRSGSLSSRRATSWAAGRSAIRVGGEPAHHFQRRRSIRFADCDFHAAGS